jgi:hypothetical protein
MEEMMMLNDSLDIDSKALLYMKILELKRYYLDKYGSRWDKAMYNMKDPYNPAYKEAIVEVVEPLVKTTSFLIELHPFNDYIIWLTGFNIATMEKDELSTFDKITTIFSLVSYLKYVKYFKELQIYKKFSKAIPKSVRKKAMEILSKAKRTKVLKRMNKKMLTKIPIQIRMIIKEMLSNRLSSKSLIMFVQGFLKGMIEYGPGEKEFDKAGKPVSYIVGYITAMFLKINF